jgi:hypothetical protein
VIKDAAFQHGVSKLTDIKKRKKGNFVFTLRRAFFQHHHNQSADHYDGDDYGDCGACEVHFNWC